MRLIVWSYAEVYKNTTPGYIQQLRLEIVTRRIQQGWTVARICNYYRTCRRTVYKWLGRFARWGLEGLKDLSRRPRRIVGKIASWVEEFIVQIRKSRPYLGPIRIKRQLEHATGYSLAAKTVHNVIVRNREIVSSDSRTRLGSKAQNWASSRRGMMSIGPRRLLKGPESGRLSVSRRPHTPTCSCRHRYRSQSATASTCW